jgi:hypothetical protein
MKICKFGILFASLPLLAATAFANPTVSAPTNASSCSSASIAAMGYSLDNSASTTIVYSSSLNASVTASTGAHTVHVKSWGQGGASCVTDVAITVTTAAVSTAAASSSGISVSSPYNGASVGSPFNLSASASSCSGHTTAALG